MLRSNSLRRRAPIATLYGEHLKIGITLIRVSVNRNGTPDSISTMSNAAGIWLTGDTSANRQYLFRRCRGLRRRPWQGYPVSVSTRW
jgi:hypothetical protein